jgi:hypothetical protein
MPNETRNLDGKTFAELYATAIEPEMEKVKVHGNGDQNRPPNTHPRKVHYKCQGKHRVEI